MQTAPQASLPNITNAFVAELANPHSYTPNSSAKLFQRSGGSKSRRVEVIKTVKGGIDSEM